MFSIFHSRGGAANIRAIQIGKYLGAKLNPTNDYENDICIYVKILPPNNYPRHSYLDIVDAPKAVEWLRTHENEPIGVIAISEVAKEWIDKVTGRNSILIPHHHCNYEGWTRNSKEVKNIGIIGSRSSFQYPIEEFRRRLTEIGLNLLYDEDHWAHYNNESNQEGRDSREKVCRFYSKIDIQVVWRPKSISEKFARLRSPLKLENAGSFGIPTIAYPEEDYRREWDGSFLPVTTIDQMINMIKLLKENPEYYAEISQRALFRSEIYHIENISKLYLKLP